MTILILSTLVPKAYILYQELDSSIQMHSGLSE